MARVPYLTAADLDPEFRDYLDDEGKTRNVWRTMANNQEVMGAFNDFIRALYAQAGLAERERELVILAVTSAVGADYAWHQHVRLGRDAGLGDEEIDAVARDDPEPFSKRDRLLVAYARAVAGGYVTDPIHEAVAERLDEETVVGVATLAATYVAVGRILDSLDVEIEAGEEFVGWSVR